MLNDTDHRRIRMRIWSMLDDLYSDDEERTSEAKALSAALAANLTPVVEAIAARHMKAIIAERDDLASAVDRVRRRHPRGDEESALLAPGLWCPTCGHERADGGYGGCPDRNALTPANDSGP